MGADDDTRNAAEKYLRDLQGSNTAVFLESMASVLASEEVESRYRQAAGLQMKNALDATDAGLRQRRMGAWKVMDAETRARIKNTVVSALGAADEAARHTAGMVIAKIAAIELPAKEWPELLPGLLSEPTATTLECLGYVCEEIEEEEDVLSEAEVYQILAAIIAGMQPDQGVDVRHKSTVALHNSLLLAQDNFTRDEERDALLNAIFSAAVCDEAKIRVVAFECVARVAELYYEYLGMGEPPYMGALYDLTFKAVTEDTEEVAVQAVEFWSTLCEHEIRLSEADAEHAGEPGYEARDRNFVGAALEPLVQLCTASMLKQDEDQDEDTWNVAMAGGTLLGLIAKVQRDAVLPFVNAFVGEHVNGEDWRSREAAMFAFGSIQEGPSSEQLKDSINGAMEVILPRLTEETMDPNAMVRDTYAWTLGIIIREHFSVVSAVHDPEPFAHMVNVLIRALMDAPRVAANVCFAIHCLADVMANWESDESSPLSPHVVDLIRSLLACSEREEWDEHNLRASAYEAINIVIGSSKEDTIESIGHLGEPVIARLQQSLDTPLETSDDREEQYALQEYLCSVLQAIANKLEARVEPLADAMVTQLLRVFDSRHATAHMEAFMAVGAIASALGEGFTKYVEAFYPHVRNGLLNAAEYQVCAMSVNCVGDLARTLHADISRYTEDLVPIMLSVLEDREVHRSVKPPLLSCFGDIAMEIGPQFERYMVKVMSVLSQAAGTLVPRDNDDLVEYLGELRESVMSAYAAIVQALNDEHDRSKLALLMPYVPDMCKFLKRVAEDEDTDEDLIQSTVGVIGDLTVALGAEVRPLINRTEGWVGTAIERCRQCGEDGDEVRGEAEEVAAWCEGIVLP